MPPTARSALCLCMTCPLIQPPIRQQPGRRGVVPAGRGAAAPRASRLTEGRRRSSLPVAVAPSGRCRLEGAWAGGKMARMSWRCAADRPARGARVDGGDPDGGGRVRGRFGDRPRRGEQRLVDRPAGAVPPDPGHRPAAAVGEPDQLLARGAAAGGGLAAGPPGFGVVQFHQHDDKPRLLRAAPNGDIFVAESYGGRVRVLRPSGICRHGGTSVFAEGLNLPFGIAFYPPGPTPQYVYVAETDKVVRFPYRAALGRGRRPRVRRGAAAGRRPAARAGALDARRRLRRRRGDDVRVGGSYSNVQEGGEDETNRAAILAFGPDGSSRGVHASGLRNPVSLAISLVTGVIWTSVNERDGLGDNLVPDFVTAVGPGQFFGWPWFYLGANVDPQHPAADPPATHRWPCRASSCRRTRPASAPRSTWGSSSRPTTTGACSWPSTAPGTGPTRPGRRSSGWCSTRRATRCPTTRTS